MRVIINRHFVIILGIIGTFLTLFINWEWNMIFAPWFSFALLIYFFRHNNNWKYFLLIIILLLGLKTLTIHNGWDFGLGLEITFSFIVCLPLLLALFIDKFLHNRFNSVLASLVFPLFFTVFDYLLGLPPLGTGFALAPTQYDAITLIQVSCVFGIWSISFLVAWFASTINHFIEVRFDLKKTKYTFNLFVIVFISILVFGSVKLMITQNPKETVKIAGITSPHKIDFWEVTDNGTIPSEKPNYIQAMSDLNNDLFEKSQRAADFGAKIIFWSEGNGVLYEDDYTDFVERGKQFARNNNVYLMMGLLVYEYNTEKNDNIIVSINPNGEVIDVYEKTITWYPTDSDGKIATFDTEYGKIGAVICFDLDFPSLVKQSYENDVEILLVPAYDTKKISPYHTKVGLLRSVDFGINIVRQVNKGTSIAVDYNGNIIGYQHYFNTDDHIMVVDVSSNKIFTIYSVIGDTFVYLNFIGILGLLGLLIKNKQRKNHSSY